MVLGFAHGPRIASTREPPMDKLRSAGLVASYFELSCLLSFLVSFPAFRAFPFLFRLAFSGLQNVDMTQESTSDEYNIIIYE